ncbi:MAG: hypothetical protein HOL77_08505 [Rhodobacteraceae bacterium]|nr:hypothetical protein [Paracoccaceae bacterium]
MKIVNNTESGEIEIVFFGLAHNKIVGGVKVIYKHAEMIAGLGVTARSTALINWVSTVRGLIIMRQSAPNTS